MTIEEQRKLGVYLFKQSCHIELEVMNAVVNHSVASCQAISTKIDEVHIEPIEGILDGTFQVDVRILSEPMNYSDGSSQVLISHIQVSHACVEGEHFF